MPALDSNFPVTCTSYANRWATLSTIHSTDEARRYELVKQLAAGDRAALGALYKLTVPLLFSVARRMLSNPADAEEVMCDVYTQVWQSAAQYDVTRGSVAAWLVMICRSRAIDRIRQNKRQPHGTDGYDSEKRADAFSIAFGSDEIVQALERGRVIHSAIAQLSPLRRRLLALAFFHDLSHQKIAATTDLALGTVKSHIRRALATLRRELETREAIPLGMISNGIQASSNRMR